MKLALLLLLLPGLFGLPDSRAAEVVIEGNKHLSQKDLLGRVSAVECDSLDATCVETICRAVADRYWEAGYLDAEVECERPDNDSGAVLVTVTEGILTNLESIEVDGSEVYGESELARLFEPYVGSPFSSARLEAAIEALLSSYDGRGYPAASVQPEMVRVGDGRLEVTLSVDEGRRARVGNVIFSGLAGTRREILVAESGIAIGGTYDGKQIDGAQARLMALGVFDEVSEPVLSFGPGDSIVTVAFEVRERRANRVEGLLAYAPGREDGEVIGSLNLELGNIAGTLRSLKVLYDRPGPNRLRWNVVYREPRLLGLPVSLDAELFSDVLEESYARRKASLGVAFRREAGLELRLGGFFGVVKDRSETGGEGDFGERGFMFAFEYEARDRPSNPRRGYVFSLTHEISSLDFDRPEVEDRTLSTLGVGGEYVFEMNPDNAVALGARFMGAFSSAGSVPASHIVRLGGAGSLRGYPEEWFGVEEALVLTTEARRVLGGDSRIYAFLDVATFEGAGRDFEDLSQLPFGYGAGFVGGSKAGVFRLEIALGRGDSFSEAKLHFGLLRRF